MADHERRIDLHGYVTEGCFVLVDIRKLSGRWLGQFKGLDDADLDGLCRLIATVLCEGDTPGGVTADGLLDLPAPDLMELVKGVGGLATVPKSRPQ